MSTPAIIPGLYLEIEKKLLIEFANAESIVNLSRVSKYAQHLLSNDFFKSSLVSKYPYLTPVINEENGSPIIFRQLSTFLPNHCWKITCTFMDRVSDKPSTMSFAFFMAIAAPSIHKVMEEKKKGCESKIKEICGSSYQDPESPIHQAWLAIQGTRFESHIKRQKLFFDDLEQKLIPEDFLRLQKSVLDAPHANLNLEKSWDFENLPKHLRGLKTKTNEILHIGDTTAIYILHQDEAKLPRNDGYQKYLHYMTLEITRAENQLELERHNTRLPHLSLPSPLTEAEVMVINAYRLSENYVSCGQKSDWMTSMTKNLPNPDLIKNFIKEFEITRSVISQIKEQAEEWNKDKELYGQQLNGYQYTECE